MNRENPFDKEHSKKEELVRKPPAPIKPKRSLLKSPLIPLTIVVGVLVVGVLSLTGYITLPHISGSWDVHKISPDATVGVPCGYEFSELISLLGSKSSIGTDIYTFYLGSGVGFPPMGLILGIDGVLKGTPKVAGTSKFQVCVKDVGGRSTCRTYSLTVNAASTPKKNSTCPTKLNPPCHSVQNGVEAYGGLVPASCNCPNDTTYAQMDNVTPGGPYKICTCK